MLRKENDWIIATIDCVTKKIVNKHILHNATEEEAIENAEKAERWFTYATGHFCNAKTYIEK